MLVTDEVLWLATLSSPLGPGLFVHHMAQTHTHSRAHTPLMLDVYMNAVDQLQPVLIAGMEINRKKLADHATSPRQTDGDRGT